MDQYCIHFAWLWLLQCSHPSSSKKVEPSSKPAVSIEQVQSVNSTRKSHKQKRRGRPNSASVEHGQDIVKTTIECSPSTLYVGAIKSKLPDHVSEKDLEQHFSKYKAYILNVSIARNWNGTTKGYGYITFSSYEIAEAARKAFRRTYVHGCQIRLNHYEGSYEHTHLRKGEYSKSATTPKSTAQRSQHPSKASCTPPSSVSPSGLFSQHDSLGVGCSQINIESISQQSEVSEQAFATASSDGQLCSAGTTLCVEGINSRLPDSISDTELLKHFSAFGEEDIVSAYIVRDPQAKQSRGYGLITFSSVQTANKAQKKYTGTYLCKKFQLRLTQVKPITVSNTPNPVQVQNDGLIEAGSNFSVSNSHATLSVNSIKRNDSVASAELSSSMKQASVPSLVDINCSETDLEFPVFSTSTDPTEVNNVHGVSEAMTSAEVQSIQTPTPGSHDLPQNVTAIPLQDEICMKSSSSNTDIIVKNLSPLVEEGELKALVNGYGGKVLSCNIQPDMIAPETCFANVSLANNSEAAIVISQLHDRVFLKHKLRVFLKPPIVTEQRKISLHLFQFISQHSHTQIEHFKQDGGVFNYQEDCAVLSCPSENIMTQFLLKVFNNYMEKTMEFKPSVWCQLTAIRDKHTPSLLDKAESSYSVENGVCILSQKDQHAVLFVGTNEGVERAHSWLTTQLDRELEVER